MGINPDMLRSLADQSSPLTLARALRVSELPSLALVGAGGKTTALFQLARELLRQPDRRDARPRRAVSSVLITTTTHLSVVQCAQADEHYILGPKSSSIGLESEELNGVVLFTSPQGEDRRFGGLNNITLRLLVEKARDIGLPLLVEADGSRQRPLKAPADHEPALPSFDELGLAWLDQVVVVAGLTGLGKPLTSEWVHRPEIYARLAMLQEGDSVNLQAVGRVLLHPDGGLKNIPASVLRSVLLNQADNSYLQSQAGRLAKSLLSGYDGVIVGSLAPGEAKKNDDSELWVCPPCIQAVHEKFAGIILAAGSGQRFGLPKQMLFWRGKPFIRHVAETALSAGLDPVVVVVGEAAPQIGTALTGLPVILVQNPDWEAGQSTSLHTGLRGLSEKAAGCVFLLADQPHISAELVTALVEAHATSLAPVIAPTAGGRRTNPVLFDRDTFRDLLLLTGDVGGRGVFSKFTPVLLPWHDASILLDIDTPEDYQRLLELE